MDQTTRSATPPQGDDSNQSSGDRLNGQPATTATAVVSSSRPRVSAVVLRAEGQEVLMVQHQRPDGTTYWQLPGGGVQLGEQLEDATLRELSEETGLSGRIVGWLFTIPYKYGISTTFLVNVDPETHAALGYDPEEVDADHRKLVGVAWRRLADVQENPEVAELLRLL